MGFFWMFLPARFVLVCYFVLLGVMVGSALDDRKAGWKKIIGILGFMAGAFAGYKIIEATFSGSEFLMYFGFRILLGIPTGAFIGWVLGAMLGDRIEQR